MAQETIDYEQKFKEDLERAQALSLESLALDRFRNEKLKREMKRNVSGNSVQRVSKPVSRASSMNEHDSNRSEVQIKGRPRPGGTGAAQNQSLIAPPPSGGRRNSTATSPCGGSNNETTPDLISFNSPPPSNTMIDLCNVLYNTPMVLPQHIMQQQKYSPNFLPSNQYMQPQAQQQRPIGWIYPQNNSQLIRNNIIRSSSQILANNSPTQSAVSQVDGVASMETGEFVQNSFSPNTSAVALNLPQLPPRNQVRHPPPISVPSSSHSSRLNTTPSNSSKNGSAKKPLIGGNLIDLNDTEGKCSVRFSILEAFDPLTMSQNSALSPECSIDDSASVCDSVYDEYDPYDFINSAGSGSNSTSDPLYASVPQASSSSPAPSVRSVRTTVSQALSSSGGGAKGPQRMAKLYECIEHVQRQTFKYNPELLGFHSMVQKLRNQFKYDSPNTNMGLVVSPMMEFQYREGTSVRLKVFPLYEGADKEKPMLFTCDVTSSVQHVTLQLTVNLEAPPTDNYTLKVYGYNEYLAPTSLLSQYEYIHNCIKLEEDIVLLLIPDKMVDKSLRRTKQDDNCDKDIKIEDIIPMEPNLPILYHDLKILLEIFEKEVDKLIESAKLGTESTDTLPTQGVQQAVKAIVMLVGSLETVDISTAIQNFNSSLESRTNPYNYPLLETALNACTQIREAVKSLISMYTRSFRVDFDMKGSDQRFSTSLVADVTDTVVIRIRGIYRPSNTWDYDSYIIAARVLHGTRQFGQWEHTQPTEVSQSWSRRVVCDCWLDLQVSVSSLSRESRLVLVIWGRSQAESQENNDKQHSPTFREKEIGWASIQFFDYTGVMAQGEHLLPIWPMESNFVYGPAPSLGTYPYRDHPVIDLEVMGPSKTLFPPIEIEPRRTAYDFHTLDIQTQKEILDAVSVDMMGKLPVELREVIWEKRHYLYNIPKALPKVLLAANSWEWSKLADLYEMLRNWKPLKPRDALQLLLPFFPDMEVRKLAVKFISPLNSDELVDFLPQLVVALKHEAYDDSPLARFLLEKSLQAPRVAHRLFWLLAQSLPGDVPQNYTGDLDESEALEYLGEIRHLRRLQLMLKALIAISGKALRNCFIKQQFLVKELHNIAVTVQNTKEAQRVVILESSLRPLAETLRGEASSLPLSATLQVCDIDVNASSYFNSNTLPLKIHFLSVDTKATVPAIFKVGDDLQQDMVTLQMIRLMDKLWLKEGLDLKIVIYGCVPTGQRRGIIEMVTNCETLRKIQVEHGLTGSFKDKPIAEWLAKYNPSELEYSRAVENFTYSCAGYCVATYLLGICDRHNDNIMLKTSGHLFHIDFGKFLGDAQMFGNFKRDRAPFVLTSDMAYVINGGDKSSEKFHKFVDLCCQAFNIIRGNADMFITLLTLMASARIKGVTAESVKYMNKALLLNLSNPEAAAHFARMIESSLKSWFTQINFFLHNLAQFKFGGESGDEETISFVPKVYSQETDGKIERVVVTGYQKRYDPDKYYVYNLMVFRAGQSDPAVLLRTFKEFCELHQKLCIAFPLAKLYSLSSGLHVGRSNIKQVADKRLIEIRHFTQSLFSTADEIAHSNLVYTFFHPLLRDQKTDYSYQNDLEEKSTLGKKITGQLKLSMLFNRDVFCVMVQHARGLPLSGNGQEPSTYVKVYLHPDHNKETKRKTKVVRRNCHPSFMEMLEYRITMENLKFRTLTATVWNYDLLQENEFLGGIELQLENFDLTTEICEWYPLTNVPTVRASR